MNLFDMHDELLKRRTFKLFEDFKSYTSAGAEGFTTTTAGSGSASVGAGLGGLLTLAPTDSTDNREVYVATSLALFSFTANKPFYGEAYLQYAEANTSAANIAFGFMSSVGAASIRDDGAGPKTSFSGAVIYKVDGGTTWKCSSSVTTDVTTSTSDTTAGGSSYVRLGVQCKPVSSTIVECTFYVDGIQLKTSGGRPGQSLIKHQLTYTGASNMQLFVCCKNGSTTAETLIVDYLAAEALRARFV